MEGNTSVFGDIKKVLCTKIALAKINVAHNMEYSLLKPKQIDVVNSALNGRDTVAVLPTGYGKSLIFELLPHVLNAYHCQPVSTPKHCVIIASPLNAIIQEQMDRNRDHAVLVTSSFFESRGDILEDYQDGHFTYIVGHPEHLVSRAAFDSFVHVGSKWIRQDWSNCY